METIVEQPMVAASRPVKSPLHVLQSYFGYTSFRQNQEAIVNAVLRKQDCFVLMPTGGGKSLCYQVPALIFDGLTVVISPLIALMKDQVDALRLHGIAAAYLNSAQAPWEQDAVLQEARANRLKLLYLAPESVFLKSIASWNISLLAVDEAHCISHWGHDFRPEYLALADVTRQLPGVPVMALTATADALTRKDIVERLALKNPATFVSSFNRPNIHYRVVPKQNSLETLLAFLRVHKDDAGIIYCLSRSATETLAHELSRHGFNAVPYHAGLARERRDKHQDMFLRDDVKIVVATIAFGMGINKSNVRYVVHMDLPKSIENYYQETGRAGRDGLPSDALLFYAYSDAVKLRYFAQVEANPEQTAVALKKLEQMAQYGDLSSCRRKFLLAYFGETSAEKCENCDACVSSKERVDGTVLAKKALSAVARLKERFGAGYVVDFLRGSKSGKIYPDHKQLPTYGVGADVSREDWTHVLRDLVAQGYLAKSEGAYPVLMLTPKSDAVLSGRETVLVAISGDTFGLPAAETSVAEPALLEELKALRRTLAARENVPAYMVLSDASLQELTEYRPHTREEFAGISGFGVVKIDKYSEAFGEVIRKYCAARGLSSQLHLKQRKREHVAKPERETETKQQSFELYQQGYAIDEIARRRGLSPSTIETHLAFYVQQGKIGIEHVVEVAKIATIRTAIEAIGGTIVTPVKNVLGDNYSFGEIRLVMAHVAYLRAHRDVAHA